MATNWDNLPAAVINDVKKALSKSTEDKTAHDALKNLFQAAEAVEEFTGIVMSLKMELDDAIGLSGEIVRPPPEEYQKSISTLFNRYTEYLAAFEPKETYLKKKVETELGSKMIYLKMRCGGLEAEWGKVTVLGTSGLSGSYVEQRAYILQDGPRACRTISTLQSTGFFYHFSVSSALFNVAWYAEKLVVKLS